MSSLLSKAVTLNDGHRMPIIGLGVYMAEAGKECYQAVLNALKLGYRHIDTAQYYENEVDVGRAVRDSGVPREEVFVTTKIWMSNAGFEPTLRSGLNSNQQLNLGYIDLLLLHAPWPERADSWRALEQLQKEGVTRSIGVSNFSDVHLKQLLKQCKVVPAVNQIELTPYLQRRTVCEYCQQNNIVLQAYSPLTRGKKLKDPKLVAIAKDLKATPAQVLLRWGIEKGFVILPKSTTPERQAENASLDNVCLTPQQMAALDKLEEGLVVGWDPLTWK